MTSLFDPDPDPDPDPDSYRDYRDYRDNRDQTAGSNSGDAFRSLQLRSMEDQTAELNSENGGYYRLSDNKPVLHPKINYCNIQNIIITSIVI